MKRRTDAHIKQIMPVGGAAADALGAGGAEEAEAGGKKSRKSNASKIGLEFQQEPGQVRKKKHNSLRAWQVEPS